MSKFVMYEKMSKKQQREINARRRKTWGEMSPVTRKPENSKAYNRKKAQQWKKDSGHAFFCAFFCHNAVHSNNTMANGRVYR